MTATHSPFVELQFLISQSNSFRITLQCLVGVVIFSTLGLGILSGYQSEKVQDQAVLASSTTAQPTFKPAVKPSPAILTSQPLTQEQKWAKQAKKANSDGKYDRLAKCETGGNWQFSNDRFAGGVGFMNVAWTQWKLNGMPDSAAEASKSEQIVVAERIRNELPPRGSFHGGKWGCANAAGLP